jgi:hypothetical protein
LAKQIFFYQFQSSLKVLFGSFKKNSFKRKTCILKILFLFLFGQRGGGVGFRLARINQGYSCVLLAVEVPTRFAYAVPMKSKSTNDVRTAFQRIHRAIIERGLLFINLTTDDGTEFTNNEMQSYLNENHINHWIKEPTDRYSLGVIDRLCRTLKTWITDWQVENEDLSWYKCLPEIIEKYNEHQNSALKASPNKLREYGDEYKTAQDTTAERGNTAIKQFHKFKVGDFVRIRLRPEEQSGEKNKKSKGMIKGVERWSNEVWMIRDIKGLLFILTSRLGKPAPRTYRQHELMLVSPGSVDVPDVFKGLASSSRHTRRMRYENL